MKNNGGPAFPHPGGQFKTSIYGMSLRDWFAGMTACGCLASEAPEVFTRAIDIATRAYEVADAMLKERSYE